MWCWDYEDGHRGYGLTFTIGRGNEVVCRGDLRPAHHWSSARTLEDFVAAPGAFWRTLTGDSNCAGSVPKRASSTSPWPPSSMRCGICMPESAGKPLWQAGLRVSPHSNRGLHRFPLPHRCPDARRSAGILEKQPPAKRRRMAQLRAEGIRRTPPRAGWLGYPDDKIRRLCREAVAEGWKHFKIKVGRDLAGRHPPLPHHPRRDRLGAPLMVDANQVWDVRQAIEWMRALAAVQAMVDRRAHLARTTCSAMRPFARAMEPPIGVATGEHGMNRVLFKQLLQARAISFCQIDSCRLGGRERECSRCCCWPRSSACRSARTPAASASANTSSTCRWSTSCAVSGAREDRVCEYVDHLHEHFTDPCRIRRGRYLAPEKPGYSTEMTSASLADYAFPGGRVWQAA